MMGFVPLGKWDTAHLHQSGKQEEEILYGHQTYNFSTGLWQKSPLLSVREKLIEREEEKNQEKLEEMEIAVSQNSDSGIVSDCNVTTTQQLPSVPMLTQAPGEAFFSDTG